MAVVGGRESHCVTTSIQELKRTGGVQSERKKITQQRSHKWWGAILLPDTYTRFLHISVFWMKGNESVHAYNSSSFFHSFLWYLLLSKTGTGQNHSSQEQWPDFRESSLLLRQLSTNSEGASIASLSCFPYIMLTILLRQRQSRLGLWGLDFWFWALWGFSVGSHLAEKEYFVTSGAQIHQGNDVRCNLIPSCNRERCLMHI